MATIRWSSQARKDLEDLADYYRKSSPALAERFEVLEVWGYIYKGQYRMRFIYAKLGDEYVLMGQEILEYARL